LPERTAIVRIVEQDENVIQAVVQTSDGEVPLTANLTKESRRLFLSKIHVEGKGLTGAMIKEAAKELGRKEGVAEPDQRPLDLRRRHRRNSEADSSQG
jgi:hypothetical protein